VEVLVRACREVGLAVQGPEEGAPYQYELSPRTEQVVAYLVGKMPSDEDLTRRVQAALLQFYGGKRAIDQAEAQLLTQTLGDQHVEALKHALFFLSRFGTQFQGDQALALVFPSPVSVQAPAGKPAPPPPTRMASPQPKPPVRPSGDQDPLMLKVGNLMAYLAPKMETLRMALAMLDPTKAGKIDLMARNARLARELGNNVKRENRPLLTTLNEAYDLYVGLTRDFRTTLPGGLPDNVKQNYFRLRVLTMNFFKEPLLKELFPPGEKAKLADA
jgi:hypothetical protein